MIPSAASQLEEQKEQYVQEIFIDTGDEDYITARWLFLNQLSRQFFWSAAQSLEKYLKAALLLNGHSVKKYNHDLIGLFKKASNFARSLIPPHLKAPEQVRLFSENRNLWGDSATEKFISRIHEHGDPSNRYDYFGIILEPSDLYKLDQVVFALRNITCKLDEIADPSDPTKTCADRIREYPNQQLRRFGAHLVNQDKAKESVYLSACENNFPFAPKAFEHQEMPLRSHLTGSRLRVLFMNNIANADLLRNWVRVINNITMSDRDLEKLKRRR